MTHSGAYATHSTPFSIAALPSTAGVTQAPLRSGVDPQSGVPGSPSARTRLHPGNSALFSEPGHVYMNMESPISSKLIGASPIAGVSSAAPPRSPRRPHDHAAKGTA